MNATPRGRGRPPAAASRSGADLYEVQTTAEYAELRLQPLERFADARLDRLRMQSVQQQSRPHLLVLGQALDQLSAILGGRNDR